MIWYLYWKTWQKYWEERSHLDYYLIIIRLYSITQLKHCSQIQRAYTWHDELTGEVWMCLMISRGRWWSTRMQRWTDTPRVPVCMCVMGCAHEWVWLWKQTAAEVKAGSGQQALREEQETSSCTRRETRHKTRDTALLTPRENLTFRTECLRVITSDLCSHTVVHKMLLKLLFFSFTVYHIQKTAKNDFQSQ